MKKAMKLVQTMLTMQKRRKTMKRRCYAMLEGNMRTGSKNALHGTMSDQVLPATVLLSSPNTSQMTSNDPTSSTAPVVTEANTVTSRSILADRPAASVLLLLLLLLLPLLSVRLGL